LTTLLISYDATNMTLIPYHIIIPQSTVASQWSLKGPDFERLCNKSTRSSLSNV